MSKKFDKTDDEIYADIYDAFLFALPLVVTEVYGAAKLSSGRLADNKSPIVFQTAAPSIFDNRKGITGGPNLDTLYLAVLLDLRHDGVVFHKPAAPEDRFFGGLVTNAYGNVTHLLGTGFLGGNDEADYLFTGPGYSGPVPDGLIRIASHTNFTHLLLRLREYPVRGDYEEHLKPILDALYIRPISRRFDATFSPAGAFSGLSEGRYDPFVKQTDLTVSEIFEIYNTNSTFNPPEPEDAELTKRFEPYGIKPGGEFSPGAFEENLAKRIEGIPQSVFKNFEDWAFGETTKPVNGWSLVNPDQNLLSPGVNFRARALLTHWGIGTNPAEISIYACASFDGDGDRLDGGQSYVLHFAAGDLPGFRKGGFWSITPYVGESLLLVENAEERYSINDKSSLVYNSDGSLDVFFAEKAPKGAPIENFLPISRGISNITLRVYLPDEKALTGAWTPPPIKKNSI
jgi:hypothetical protein